MDKEFCYKNHHKIKERYKYLSSKEGKENFMNRVKMLQEPESKKVMLDIFKKNWNQYAKLIDIIEKLCLRIVEDNLSNISIKIYAKNLHSVLNKINSAKQLYTFIYKLLVERVLYDRIIKFYEMLSDKSKCVLLFR